MVDTVLDHLDAIYRMSDVLREYLQRVVTYKAARRKDILLQPPEVARHLYFVESGMTRCYYIKDGEEVSSWFMGEGNFITSVLSFFPQKSSFEFIVAMEDCCIYMLCYEDFQYCRRNFLEFNLIALELLASYYMQSEERLVSLRRMSAQEKIAYINERLGDLLQRVPKRFIASYMDLAPWALSRSYNP
jgi:CRP-like cAMP-binding protein